MIATRSVLGTLTFGLVAILFLAPASAAPWHQPDLRLAMLDQSASDSSVEQVRHELAAVTEAYATARDQAVRALARCRNQPLLVDDLTTAIGYGDDAVKSSQSAEQWAPRRTEDTVRFLWAVVAHIVNVTNQPPTRA